MSLDKDHCRVRTDGAPMILVILHNVATHLLNRRSMCDEGAAVRRHTDHLPKALLLIRPPG